MKFSLKELKRISMWFDETSADLNDEDLKIYEKVNICIKEEEDSDDPLAFPVKKLRKYKEKFENNYEDEEKEFDDKEEFKNYMLNYEDEEK